MTDLVEPEQSHGEVFLDARGNGRAMRLSWHPEADMVVLSLWRADICAGTFRMSHADVGAFIDTLIDGLRDAPGVHMPPRYGAAVPQRHPTQPISSAQPAFIDWAFGPTVLDGQATAS